MLRYDHVSDFTKAAPRRLEDAKELLTQPALEPQRSDSSYRHLTAAEYLSGYAVECILKVYIITRTMGAGGQPARTWTEALAFRKGLGRQLAGAKSHDLERLLSATDLERQLRRALRLAWGIACKWEPALRYRGQPNMDRQRAVELVSACEQVYRWVQARAGVPR